MLSGGKKSLRNDMAILGDLVNISWIFYMDSMIFYYVWIFSFFFFFFLDVSGEYLEIIICTIY